MQMDRTSRKSRTIGSKFFDANCAQVMRCNPVPGIIRKRKQRRNGPIMQRLKFVQSNPKSDLPCGQFAPVASAELMIQIVRLSVESNSPLQAFPTA
jgi:hypothetical protein